MQQRDIQGVDGYEFQAIENEALSHYDGGAFSIYDLNIRGYGSESAGMFGAFSGEASASKTLENIRLVNTRATAESGPSGALVGSGSYLTIDNCQVYWENRSEETTNLRDVLGDSTNGFRYQITGSGPAGGLAGTLTDSTLTGCSASSLVQSQDSAGGLVGQGGGLALDCSYAASYLAGPAAAGLVGNLTGHADIYGSYAVGFINKGNTPAKAAGLCLGSGTAAVTSSYSAMLFPAAETVTNYPLCENGTYSLTHFLDSDHFNFQGETGLGVSYNTLIDATQWKTLFGSGVFSAKNIVQSHPYNLQTTLSLTTFTYPGLRDLDHWGDWGAQFQNGSLVYYEIYQGTNNNTYGFNGGGLDHLSDDKHVVGDGYAVAYKGTDPISGIGATLKVTYQTSAGSSTEEFSYGSGEENPIYEVANVSDATGKTENYYLLPLPSQVVNSDYAASNFYQTITIQDIPDTAGTMAKQKSYYYSPHFANTVLSSDEVTEAELPAKARLLQVEVRTPRHLYHLSRLPSYYSSNNQYRFLQQLDLDYDTYTGYGLFTENWSQAPIGLDADSPFRCIYYGNYHSITGVVPAVQDEEGRTYQHVGLFGYTIGVLRDIVYQMKDGDTLSVTQAGSSSEVLYVGALAGYNGGTVENCAASEVRLQANGYQYSTIYLGGLVGENHGTIQTSAAEGASITANASMSHAYAGGFVGENTAGGIIDQCYAVGKVSVTQARYGTVYACGFAGRSSATLSRCYSAVSLLADGEAQRYGFCPDNSTNCVYLNNGNFTYRTETYAALYEDRFATPVTWEALAGQAESSTSEEMERQVAAVDALDMQWGATSNWKADYPYPAVVTAEKNGTTSHIHYGQWPERMDLGTMGVYYWEKLTIGQSNTYYISAISLAADAQVMKSGTLSTAHGDGGVVTEYGYGYFLQTKLQEAGIPTTLTSSGIGYNSDTSFVPNEAQENKAANEALAALMDGQYTFHSYNIWQAEKSEGLFVPHSGQASNNQPPYGTWTLEQGAYSLTVRLNPFFADAMSCPSANLGTAVPKDLPGTEKNPYEVRSIEQLQFINWNSNAKNTVRRMDTGNMEKFPYLCYGTGGNLTIRSFYWEQTHDLKGTKGKTYTPIAAVYDDTSASQGVLFGWFGGTYNGNDYLIADVNIAPHSGELIDATSCVGLFGAVYNGTLKNIVLYSADGTAMVKGTNCGMSRWFSIGALAGVAGSSTGSSVVNCTVAGYTIKDTHRSTSAGGWGGTGLGGLIGVSDMSLKGCSAVTDIVLDSTNNDHVRMGGLVGSCQGSISSCYAGGSLEVTRTSSTPNNRGIYIGGVVGGIYMKPLKVGGSNATVGKSGEQLQNTLNNCYTYAKLPAADSNPFISGLYAVGGSGELNVPGTSDGNADHGWTNYHNNYYLSSVVLSGNNGFLPTWNPVGSRPIKTDSGMEQVKGMTYGQMADADTENGLLEKLNSKISNADEKFSVVTTETASGNPLSGRYSFGSDPSLLGRDYPFPTILTQSSNLVANGKANVHYGDWPLAGIRRENGALPVNLDLFADYKTEDKGAVHTESLSLEGVSSGGTWEFKIQDENNAIIEADLTPNGDGTQTLSITALKTGSTVVTVTYTLDGSKYTQDIEVNVTAELRLAAKATSPIPVFTNATVQTALELRDRDNKALSADISIALEHITVEIDPDYFAAASVTQEDGLFLTADSGANAGNTQLTVGYDFTYLENNYHATSSIALRLITPEITVKPLTFTFGANGQEQSQSQEYTGSGDDAFTVSVDGSPLKINALTIVGFEGVLQEYKDIILVEWAKDAQGQEQIGTLSILAYPQTVYPAYASVRVQFQYEYAGSTHIVWKELPVELKKEAAGDGGTGTEEEQP